MCGWGGAGGDPLGRSPGWSCRAGRPSALPPPLLGAGRWPGRTGVWVPSWCWVPLRARTFCLSAGSGNRRSSVLSARSARRSLVLPRSLVAAVCCFASCNGKVVSLRVPGLYSSVLWAPRCSRDYLGLHTAVAGALAIAAAVPPSGLPVSIRHPSVPPASWFSVAWAVLPVCEVV